MKTKFILSLIFSLALLIFVSCNWIDPDLNVDPTSPEEATMEVILPTTQIGYGYVLGGDIGRYAALFTKHLQGVDRQHSGLYRYNLKEDDLNNAWLNMYTGPMVDLNIMLSKADKETSPHYKGVAQVLMASCLGMWTDILGPIPYSEAFQGEDNLTPVYDSQEDIYNTIQQLLDDAINNFAAENSTFSPGGEDFIYGGDLTKWTNAAYTLKARYYLHIKDYTKALNNAANGLAANADNFMIPFGDKESEANPFYQFMDERGDVRMGEYLMPLMNDLEDPRRPAFAAFDEGDTAYAPSNMPGPYYASINSPVPLALYSETKFIEAECMLANGNTGGAYQAYLDGVEASLEQFDVSQEDIDTYMANADVAVGEANFDLEQLIEQKYIALYTMPESWSDWRRTGYPALTPVQGNNIPRRFFYPQHERLFNGKSLSEAVPNHTSPNFIFGEVWWDSNFWQ